MKKVNKKSILNLLPKKERFILKEKSLGEIKKESVKEIIIDNNSYYQLNPASPLSNIHDKINTQILKNIPLNNSAVAFRSGISYLNLFEPHRSGYYFLRLDIKSFFHSISLELLRDSLTPYFEDEFINDNNDQLILDAFINLITYTIPSNSPNTSNRGRKVVPIGFKTSPQISNIIFRKIDLLIQGYCSDHKITYTRYADDMLFSTKLGNKYLHSELFINQIGFILSKNGFKINTRKTIHAEHTISLNGYIIENNKLKDNATIRISNKKTKVIKTLIYKLDKKVTPKEILKKHFDFNTSTDRFKHYVKPASKAFIEKFFRDQLLNKMTGYRSYIISILKFHNKFHCIEVQYIINYNFLLEDLNKKIESLNRL